MNGAILVSQFLQTGRWEDAIEKLQAFWIDKKKGLASTPSQGNIEKFLGWTKWQEASNNNNLAAASKEAARRYYSAKYFAFHGVPNMYISPYQQRFDFKFFDDGSDFTTWFIHSIKPLQDSIEHLAHFPIATSFDKREPRLLVFSLDVAEGETVTFDSYEKSDGSRKSEYGKYTKEKGYENAINYNDGISIDHVMASGTLPEFYDYREIDGHKFWDGGMLRAL
jgi:NTE family protein